MPLYDYVCDFCGYTGEHIAKIDAQVHCPACKTAMVRQMPCTHGIAMGAAGAYGYFDQNLGCYIGTNRQRREEMRRQGVAESHGKGWR